MYLKFRWLSPFETRRQRSLVAHAPAFYQAQQARRFHALDGIFEHLADPFFRIARLPSYA
jgi:hypothetical protein